MQLYTVIFSVSGIGISVSSSTMLVRVAWTCLNPDEAAESKSEATSS